MIPFLPENGIVISFPENWHPIKYDTCNAHTRVMMPLQNTCAVDYVCCHAEKVIFFEVKHFTGKQIDVEYLINEISQKFRDTLCGIAVCRMRGDSAMQLYSDALFFQSPTTSHKFVLFLEIDRDCPGLPAETIKANILKVLKMRFSCMNFAVRIHDSKNSAMCPWQAEVI